MTFGKKRTVYLAY